MSYRNRDNYNALQIAQFCDKYLYSQDYFSDFKRIEDKQQQIAGSDIILSIPSKNLQNIIIDEKAQACYANKPLDTFCLELSFISKNKQLIEGWFTNPKNITQYYLLQWIHATDIGSNGIVPESHIQEIEFILVSKVALLDYCSFHKFDLDKLRNKAAEIRRGLKDYNKYDNENFWFVFSEQLKEKPINLILKKDIFIMLSLYRGTIKRLYNHGTEEYIWLNMFDNQLKTKSERILQVNKGDNEILLKNHICPYCGNDLVERKGIYGSFLGCSNYPSCTFTHELMK